MVEVEIGFQLEDFFALIKRLLPSLKYLTHYAIIAGCQDIEDMFRAGTAF